MYVRSPKGAAIHVEIAIAPVLQKEREPFCVPGVTRALRITTGSFAVRPSLRLRH
jgi:hypothetical protein